jgi:LysM repeat protein
MRRLAATLLILALAVPFGGVVAQDDTPSPAITISSPADGAVLEDLDAISVSGTGTALFENSLTVRALDSTGGILDEQPVTTDAPEVGGTGDWSATLAVDVAPGTAGSIYAFAVSANDGSIVAEAQVNVTYGTAGPQPAITITSPTPGAIVTNSGAINATGTATAVHEGVVTVRALGAADAVLAEVSTTAEGSALGGTGDWEASLTVAVAAGTIGKIVAFATSADDGSVTASASVSVIYGEAPMRAIRITGPAAGSLVGTLNGFAVTGTSLNIPEGNVVVQVRDAANNVLAQQTVTSSAAAGEGNWQAALAVILPADTPGNIYAFSTSPADGSVLAFDQVNVTFQANCSPRTDWTTTYSVAAGDTLFSIAQQVGSTVTELARANCLTNASVIVVGQQLRVPNPPASPEPLPVELTITSPTAGSVLPSPATIRGTVAGAGTVVVRALDNQGNVLAEERVALEEAGPFEVSLTLAVESGTRGMIYAYAPSAADGSPAASAAVHVAYGADTAVPVVTITSPLPYSTLAEETFTVTGSAESVFEGGVVVEALDAQGNILVQVPVTAETSEVGGVGDWTADLTVNVPSGTRGSIVAYATSPQDGSRAAEARIDVIFGVPGADEPFVSIVSPLPHTQLLANEVISVAGYSREAPTFTVVIALIDANGQVLALQTAPTDPETGFWQVELLPGLFEPGAAAHVVALFATQPNGTVTESDNVGVMFEMAPTEIAG